LGHPHRWTDLLGPAEAKEKILKALSARRVVERGWLTALLNLYLAKRKEAKVRLKTHRRRSVAEEGLRDLGKPYVICY